LVSKQVASILTILGGVFYIIGSFFGSVIFAGVFGIVTAFSRTGTVGGFIPTVIMFLIWGSISGATIVVGGALLNSELPLRRKIGGIIAIIAMVVGVIPSLAGFAVGFILTLIGTVVGLTYKEGNPDVVIGMKQIDPYTASPRRPLNKSRYCIKCGAILNESAEFCGACGTEVP